MGHWASYAYLKPRTAGETGGLKWQCVAYCHFSCCTSRRRTLPPPTAYSSQDARGACDARSSSAAHGSATTVGTVAPKTPAMGWARPTTCAYRSLSTQCPGPAEQAGVALDTAHPIGLQCCQHPYRQSRTSGCRQDSI